MVGRLDGDEDVEVEDENVPDGVRTMASEVFLGTITGCTDFAPGHVIARILADYPELNEPERADVDVVTYGGIARWLLTVEDLPGRGAIS
jgi:hypothetical protein